MIPILSRAGAIVARPRETWPAIARERTSVLRVYLGYVVPLAAIGPLATFIALHVVGVRVSRIELYRMSAAEAFAAALPSFAYALLGVALIAGMLSLLAPLFGAPRGFARAVRITAYAYTPAWLAGALLAYPPLRGFQLVAAGYALYLLALGVHAVMSLPQRRAALYAASAIVCAVAAGFGLGALAAALRSLELGWR